MGADSNGVRFDHGKTEAMLIGRKREAPPPATVTIRRQEDSLQQGGYSGGWESG